MIFVSLVLVTFVLLCRPCISASPDLAWPEVKEETRPWTRWWWLGSAVDDSSLAFRLGEMEKAGIGGVEITPIYGTKGFEKRFIDFLSPGWMQALSSAVSDGKRLGMGVDMITGTGWPFGGGPVITPELAATKSIFLKYKLDPGQRLTEPIAVTDPKQKDVAKLLTVMAFSNNGDVLNLTRFVLPDGRLDWNAAEGEWKIIAVFAGKTQQKVKRAAPGGEGWVMDHFSRTALDAYLARFTKAFRESGCPAPHTFFNDSYEVYGADWTFGLFDEFAKRRGYRLEEHLPEFLGEGDADKVARVKCDYRETVSDMLLENFTIPWTAWAHGLGSLTRNQAHGSPGNLIDLYGAADVPECESFGATWFDIPGFRWEGELRMSEANPVLMKFASSAAHLNGGAYASSETFTWLTEHFRTGLSQCKPQLDQMFCAGVNRVLFHGTPYSPKNAPWPGWQFYASVNFSSYNTIWRDIRPFTEYITRCQSFLQAGLPDNAFLVYWPLHDLWTGLKGDPFYPFSKPLNEWLVPSSFFQVVQNLRKGGYDLDYVSDRYLARASVRNGKVVLPGGAAYPVLAVPPCKVMSTATAKKIVSLAKAGAKVVFMENLPSDVPGLAKSENGKKELTKLFSSLPVQGPFISERMDGFGKGMVITGADMDKTIALCGQAREEITEHGVQFIRRKNSEGFHYFFSNLHSKELDNWVTLGVDALSAALYDPLTGKSGMAKLRKQEGKTQVYLQLKPGESVILKTFYAPVTVDASWSYVKTKSDHVELSGKWTLSFIEGEPRIDRTYDLDKLVSWTELDTAGVKTFAGTGKYTLAFTLPEVKADDWVLDLGQVNESARVAINGRFVGTLWSLPFRANVGSYFVPGLNLLDVEVTNTPANRIADLERRKVEWKIFDDINVVNRAYKPFDASAWEPMPSGLIGPVTLTPQQRLF
jgi:hypothetical protein